MKDSCLWNLESVGIDSNEIVDVHYRCSTFIAKICEPVLGAGATDGLGHLFPKRIPVFYYVLKMPIRSLSTNRQTVR